jgi:hypothetical protein
VSRITTPIQPFSDTFRREVVGMADSIEWWDRYRGEMERLVSEPRQFDQDNRSVTKFKVFEVTGSAVELADGRWSYTMVEVTKATDGYGGWSTLSGGISTNFGFNFYEDMNDGSGTEGNGVDVDGQDFPANFSIQPVPVGTIVLAYRVYPQNGSDVEWWFSYVNAVDGQCDDPPAGSLDQPMIYVGKATSTTSTSSSYADITSMDDPAV